MLITIGVVRGASETEDETVSLLRAGYHPWGNRRQNESGSGKLYGFITGESVFPVRYQYPLRVQQINYAKLARSAIGPLVSSLLLILYGHKLVRSKRIQNWLASRRD